MALDKVSIDEVKIHQTILVDITLLIIDLLAHTHRVLKLSQPISRLALLNIRFRTHVVAKDDRGEQHWVTNLQRARLEMAHTLNYITAWCPLAISHCHSSQHIMGQHQLPAPRESLLPNIALSEQDL